MLDAFGREMLNGNGERLLAFAPEQRLATLNTFFRTSKKGGCRSLSKVSTPRRKTDTGSTTYSSARGTDASCGYSVSADRHRKVPILTTIS